MSSKKHLTASDRLQIEYRLTAGMSLREIGKALGKSTTTISREIKKHAVESDKGAAGRIKNRCVHRFDCKKGNLCPHFPCVNPRHQLNCRILPKGTSFDRLSQLDVNRVLSHVDSYAREKLNDKSPFESFSFLFGKDILDKLGIWQVPAVDIVLTPALLKC